MLPSLYLVGILLKCYNYHVCNHGRMEWNPYGFNVFIATHIKLHDTCKVKACSSLYRHSIFIHVCTSSCLGVTCTIHDNLVVGGTCKFAYEFLFMHI